jgi:plasmid stabilization system protein ParE
MKLRFSPAAEAAYEAAFDYLYERNPSAAVRFVQDVERVIDRLQRFPNLGHYITEYPSHPYKEVVIWSHRFFYRVVGQSLWVVGVWHTAQLPDEPRLPQVGADQ